MKGPRPLPTNLKLLRRDRSHHAANRDEPKPPACEHVPTAPNYLNRRAKAEWRRMAKELHVLGLLTKIDLGGLAGYCAAYADFAEANYQMRDHPEELVLHGEKGSYMNPILSVKASAMKQMKAFLTEFGMTPSSRSRVKATPPATEDKFADFIAQGKK